MDRRYLQAILITAFIVSGVKCLCELGITCITDLTPEDCAEGTHFVQNSSVHNCCPRCELGTGEICSDEESCTPESISSGEEPPLQGSCLPTGGIYPSCLDNGVWAPVQCKGDEFTGRCFCADTDGNRIFGQMWRYEASEMTCACSRHRWHLESSGRRDVTLHCTSTGDYEPLQCDDGLCWCTDPMSGQPTTMTVLDYQMELLPCYDAAEIGAQYLRQCESVLYAQNVLNKEQMEHGTFFYPDSGTLCNYDGSYGAYKNLYGILYCTDRKNNILGAWQSAAEETVNCNCAMDTSVIFPAAGITQTQVCLYNGNYRPHQTSGGKFYCVDTDGYPATEFLDQLPADSCASYA